MQQLALLIQEHPVAFGAATASIIAAIVWLSSSYSSSKSKQKQLDSSKTLISRGPEYQVVKLLQSIGDRLQMTTTRTSKSNSKKKHQKSGLASFFLRRDQVAEFFSQSSDLIESKEFLPFAESREAVRLILMKFATQCQFLELRRKESFSDENEAHVAILEKLWKIGVDNNNNKVNNNSNDDETTNLPFERLSGKWEKLGFQGQDPATDLRAGGMLALDLFADFVEANPELVKGMQKHCAEKQAEGSMNWLLMACASVNISVQIFGRQFSEKSTNSNNNNQLPICWTEPILMAIFRGSAGMKFQSDGAKIVEGENRKYFLATPEDYRSGVVRVFDNVSLEENEIDEVGVKKWTLFQSLCRVHHHLMKRLFSEWITKDASVMEFERFIVDNVYEPFFLEDALEGGVVLL